ncbi:MAG TPA: porin family protein [Mucilaginibacter sp.]|jgi:hypothetical protein
MKIILFLAMSLLATASVSAQDMDPGYLGDHPYKIHLNSNSSTNDFYKPRIGFEGGVSISNTVNAYDSKFSTGSIIGFHGGLMLELPLFYPLAIAPEVLYSQKGYAANTADGNFTQRTQYIDVPLLAKFKVGPVFNIYIGPQISYLLSTQNIVDNGTMVTSEHYTLASPYHHVFSGVGGVSFDLGRYVELHARYVIDFQPIAPGGNATYLDSYRNQVLQFGLEIKL